MTAKKKAANKTAGRTNPSAGSQVDGAVPPVRFICMMNRTGSTWLCEMLNESGLDYLAGEWFRPGNERVPFEPTPEGRAAQWQKLLAEHRESGQRLVIKCNIGQMIEFQQLIGPDVVRESRFVFLRRDDLVGQAISQFLLELREAHKIDAIGVHMIDPERIVKIINIYRRGNEQWRKWLDQNVSRVTGVFYETMVDDPLQVLRQVVSHLDSPELGYRIRSDVEWSKVEGKNQVPFATHWREAVRRFEAGDEAWREALAAPVEGQPVFWDQKPSTKG